MKLKTLEGEGWCECKILNNGLNIGEARYEKDYDNLGSAIFHFEISKDNRRKGLGTKLLKLMVGMIKESPIRIIIGESCYDEEVKQFLVKNKFTDVKPSEQYFAMEGMLNE